MTVHGIEISESEVALFCQQYRIHRLSFFGSVLRDDFRPTSDIDVLVEFEPDARIGLRFFSAERELSDMLGRRVDLHTLGFIGTYIRDDVMAEAKVLYDAA